MKHIFFLLVMAALTACSTPPYVHKSGEFNRAASDFGQPVKDISSVTICYSSYAATPGEVTKLAVAECAAFNKTAEFKEQSYEVCPLATPVAAVYNCLGSGNAEEGKVIGPDGQAIPGGTLMNYDGIPFRY